MSWEIILLYFFSWNFTCYWRKYIVGNTPLSPFWKNLPLYIGLFPPKIECWSSPPNLHFLVNLPLKFEKNPTPLPPLKKVFFPGTCFFSLLKFWHSYHAQSQWLIVSYCFNHLKHSFLFFLLIVLLFTKNIREQE